MIYVRVNAGDIPADWLAKAAKLSAGLMTCTDDGPDVPEDRRKSAKAKRAKLIEDNQAVWKALKSVLMDWSHNKCWYSELRDDGSDYHVDHFRPKSSVKNPREAERDGYWWLAFEWTNFRISVAWCNSQHKGEDAEAAAKGKQDQFPLGPKGKPALVPEDSLDEEDVILLDPCNRDDVALMDFDETGLPVAAGGGWVAERVKQTVDVLHLDAPRMKEARQLVWRRCAALLAEAHQLVNQAATGRGTLDRPLMERRFSDLRDMLSPAAELSAVARACVIRSGLPWCRPPHYSAARFPG